MDNSHVTAVEEKLMDEWRAEKLVLPDIKIILKL